jgi:hypothetical protein
MFGDCPGVAHLSREERKIINLAEPPIAILCPVSNPYSNSGEAGVLNVLGRNHECATRHLACTVLQSWKDHILFDAHAKARRAVK